MKTCVQCGSKDFERMTQELRQEIAGHSYIMNAVDVPKCAQCGETYLPGCLLGSFELLIAWHLVSHGVFSGDVLRFTRKALGLRAVDLASLLGVTAEHFSKWENDQLPLQVQPMALVAEMVNDRLHNRTTTTDLLKAIKEPRPIAKVPITLNLPPPMAAIG
jgi:hypothetical protein